MPVDWKKAITPFYAAEDGCALYNALEAEYGAGAEIYPVRSRIFAALEATPYASVKAVWLGQDPYHGEGQAIGMAFAVPDDVKAPPSLKNIFKEYAADLQLPVPHGHTLKHWADNGVLLLNTALTVRAGQPASHSGLGWDKFIRAILQSVAAKIEPVAFILLGNNAKTFRDIADNGRHVIFEAAHPSPLSAYRGFFGSCPFSTVNHMLEERGVAPIDWRLE